MADINWGLAAATTAGGVLVVSVAVALDFVGDGPWALVPTAVGVVADYAIYRVFGDGDPLADVLS